MSMKAKRVDEPNIVRSSILALIIYDDHFRDNLLTD